MSMAEISQHAVGPKLRPSLGSQDSSYLTWGRSIEVPKTWTQDKTILAACAGSVEGDIISLMASKDEGNWGIGTDKRDDIETSDYCKDPFLIYLT